MKKFVLFLLVLAFGCNLSIALAIDENSIDSEKIDIYVRYDKLIIDEVTTLNVYLYSPTPISGATLFYELVGDSRDYIKAEWGEQSEQGVLPLIITPKKYGRATIQISNDLNDDCETVEIEVVENKNWGLHNYSNSKAYADGQFQDVSSSDWFYDSVKDAYEYALMQGQSNILFGPKEKVTVGETIALAARLHNIYHGGDGNFEQSSPWYQIYADYAIENKIIDHPMTYEAYITRSDFAAIICNSVPVEALPSINSIPNGGIPDLPSDSDSTPSVYTLYRAGILTGGDEYGTFYPNTSIDRASVAAIITRIAALEKRKTFSLVLADSVRDRVLSAETLQGTWQFENATSSGDPDDIYYEEITFSGNRFIYTAYLASRQTGRLKVSLGGNNIQYQTGTFEVQEDAIILTAEKYEPGLNYIGTVNNYTRYQANTYSVSNFTNSSFTFHTEMWHVASCKRVSEANRTPFVRNIIDGGIVGVAPTAKSASDNAIAQNDPVTDIQLAQKAYDRLKNAVKFPDTLKIYGIWAYELATGYKKIEIEYSAENNFGQAVRNFYVVTFYENGNIFGTDQKSSSPHKSSGFLGINLRTVDQSGINY